MQFQLVQVEIQSVQVCWIYTALRCKQTQFRSVKVPSLGYHMVFLHLSYPSYELERTIYHLNLTIYKHWNEEKILSFFEATLSSRINGGVGKWLIGYLSA